MKAAIVLDEALGPGYLANAAACITSGLFHGEDSDNVIGAGIEGEDCTFIPITKIPILILRKGHKDMQELWDRAKANNLKHMILTREGQSTPDYDEYIERVKGKTFDEVNIIGFGVIGEDDIVTKFAGDLPLFR